MNVDQEVMLSVIEQLEDACAALRRIFALPALIEIANNSTRATFECKSSGCDYRAYEADDLQAHREIVHGLPRVPGMHDTEAA